MPLACLAVNMGLKLGCHQWQRVPALGHSRPDLVSASLGGLFPEPPLRASLSHSPTYIASPAIASPSLEDTGQAAPPQNRNRSVPMPHLTVRCR